MSHQSLGISQGDERQVFAERAPTLPPVRRQLRALCSWDCTWQQICKEVSAVAVICGGTSP